MPPHHTPTTDPKVIADDLCALPLPPLIHFLPVVPGHKRSFRPSADRLTHIQSSSGLCDVWVVAVVVVCWRKESPPSITSSANKTWNRPESKTRFLWLRLQVGGWGGGGGWEPVGASYKGGVAFPSLFFRWLPLNSRSCQNSDKAAGKPEQPEMQL